ncbi:MAG: molecular chaperone TorD family protein [Coriobacteriaceae bacterium]|nr:molecular chaperone TorD family protein [Coriobacteriaceae bacterium]
MATKEEAIEIVEARASMYETLASLYFDPVSEERIEAMAAQDYTDLRNNPNELIASGFNDIYRYLRKRNTGTRQELSVDFTSCFLGMHSYKGLVAQPYESLFLDPSGELYAAPRKEVHSFYKRECVALQSGYDYPEDHLAFECEFMSILCHRTSAALEEDNTDEALRLLDVQSEFMEEHINRWFRRLHDLALKFIKTRFYRGVLDITQGFFDSEPASISNISEEITKGFEPAPEKEDAGEESTVETSKPEEDAAAEGAE